MKQQQPQQFQHFILTTLLDDASIILYYALIIQCNYNNMQLYNNFILNGRVKGLI